MPLESTTTRILSPPFLGLTPALTPLLGLAEAEAEASPEKADCRGREAAAGMASLEEVVEATEAMRRDADL